MKKVPKLPNMPIKTAVKWIFGVVGIMFWFQALTLGLFWISQPNNWIVLGGAVVLTIVAFIGVKVLLIAIRNLLNWWYDNVLAP